MTAALTTVLDRLADDPLAARVERDAPLGARTTYRVGGSAAALLVVDDAAELERVAAATAGTGVDVVTVGRGSNLLVSDDGFPGLALVLGAGFENVTVDGTTVVAGGAAKLPVVARTTAGVGLTGFEWAVGVPGSIGGAVRMNAGGHGAEMVDSLVDVDVVDLATGERTRRTNADLVLGYRSSALGASEIVASARIELAHGDEATSRAELNEIVQWRRDNQPGGQNAGSVFTNPPGDSAGRLIDAAGLKGFRIGTASVSAKHANFIQADPGGRAEHVLAVMDAVRAKVAEVHGVELVAETHLVGFGPRLG